MGKEIVKPDDIPRTIKGIQFDIASPTEIIKLSQVQISNREFYNITDRQPVPHGVLDRRLGISDKNNSCNTCGLKLADCPGHFGHISLVLPVWHIGYFKAAIQVLQDVCKVCSALLLQEDQKFVNIKRLRMPNLDSIQRENIIKSIHELCRKTAICPKCGAPNGIVKKVNTLKVVHEKRATSRSAINLAKKISSLSTPSNPSNNYSSFNPSNSAFTSASNSILNSLSLGGLEKKFANALVDNPDLRNHLHRAQHDITPLVALNLFQNIKGEDCELLGVRNPSNFLWTQIPVPPASIRPSVPMSLEGGSNEDDLTVKLSEIVYTNEIIKEALEKGITPNMLMEDWDFLQLQCALYINSEIPGVPLSVQSKPIRGLCQRLKGKMGRFRGNLSGKRVDFSARTVISPDPNLAINQVGVPVYIAKILTFPEVVTPWNINEMKKAVINGPDIHPGANFVQQSSSTNTTFTSTSSLSNGFKRYLKFGDRIKIAKDLRVGDIIERHLKDGDVVLFNRQPSLHKLSIMSHFAIVKPWRTFRFNECVCTPYNADFDGDEMNLHFPQTLEARAEAMELMGVKNNLVTPRNGQPLVAATQDFITAAYVLTQKNVFLSREDVMQCCSMMSDAHTHFDLPPPAILEPIQRWTGKQVFSLLIRPNRETMVLVNLDAKCRTFAKPVPVPVSVNSNESGGNCNGNGHASSPFFTTIADGCMDFCQNDGYLIMRNSELLAGTIDKSIIGGDSKNSIFYVIMREYGNDYAIKCMSRMAKLAARWLGNRGFSIGIDDVQPSNQVTILKESLVNRGYEECNLLISQFNQGKLEAQSGCTVDQTLESKISGTLSKIRDDVGQICLQELGPYNSPLIMQWCGSKGSKINVSQMVACVGQQIINGQRIADGFEDRTLPHFPKFSRTPAAKGFVRNSFYSGLSPTEFFFHAISGREGLVDTAVKTAETGYMQRRLMKALEDLSIQYDISVRNSTGDIIQFCYGDDGLDPAMMEGESSNPVNFSRLLIHCKTICPEKEGMDENSNVNNENEIKNENIGLIREKEKLETTIQSMMNNEIYSANFKRDIQEFILKNPMTVNQLTLFIDKSLEKYIKAIMEPGTAVGALGAQSIGEPGTQMTLKTFHFAGVASMNVTLGVPRIKEIINASKVISTPIITAPLITKDNLKSARIVKGRIEKTLLGDIMSSLEEVYSVNSVKLRIQIDLAVIQALQLEIDLDQIEMAITRHKKFKIKSSNIAIHHPQSLIITINDDMIPLKGAAAITTNSMGKSSPFKLNIYFTIQQLKSLLPQVTVKGYSLINRAVINNLSNGSYNLLAEGYGLREVMTTEGILGTACTSNHIMEVEKILGIEAARISISNEIQYTMAKHGMTIDQRHLYLLSDCMTAKGQILGITRFGIGKMKDSALMLASFERTTDNLFDAARFSKRDTIDGVSECIIMGMPMPVGTGLFKIVQKIDNKNLPERKELIFDRPEWHPKIKF